MSLGAGRGRQWHTPGHNEASASHCGLHLLVYSCFLSDGGRWRRQILKHLEHTSWFQGLFAIHHPQFSTKFRNCNLRILVQNRLLKVRCPNSPSVVCQVRLFTTTGHTYMQEIMAAATLGWGRKSTRLTCKLPSCFKQTLAGFQRNMSYRGMDGVCGQSSRHGNRLKQHGSGLLNPDSAKAKQRHNRAKES